MAETKDIEEKEEIVIENDNSSDDALDFFTGSDSPRENFEHVENEDDEDQEEGEEQNEQEQPTISETSEEDEQYFKIVVGFLDNTRAMGLSFYATGGMESVDKYTYYTDWNDKKHKQFLEAGCVVAKKHKFSAFKNLPEMVIVIAIIISTGMLFSQAKKEKLESATKAAQPSPSQGADTKIRKLGPLTKVI